MLIRSGTTTYVTRDTFHKACPQPGGMTHITICVLLYLNDFPCGLLHE